MTSYPASRNRDPSVTSAETDLHQLYALLFAVKPYHPSDDVGLALHTSFLPKRLSKYANAKGLGRTANYLDALAMILVSRKGSQVFAVVAEVKSSAPLKLTVAENNGNYDEAAEHLQNVWRVLARISNITYPGPQHVSKQSPKRTVPRDQYIELANIIYKHSFSKLLSRLKKAAVIARDIFLYIEEAQFPQELKELGEIVMTAIELRTTLEANGKNGISEDFISKIRDFGIVCTKFFKDSVTSNTSLGLSSFNQMRVIHAGLLEPFTNEKLDHFEKKIRKSVDITNAMMTLMELATSKRMHSLFRTEELDVETLQCEKGVYDLPKGDRWRMVVEKNLDKTMYDENASINKLVGEQSDKAKQMHDSSKNPRACTTHCEVAIVAHFMENSSNTIPYIGVSKLSCRLCSEFLAAYAGVSPSKEFCTRGCSGQWSFPWKFPNILVGSGVDEKMRLNLIQIFNKHMKDQIAFKRTGNTSSGSGGSNVDEDSWNKENVLSLSDRALIERTRSTLLNQMSEETE